MLEARWEEHSSESSGRPPRHLYRLTGAGRELARQLAPATAAPRRGEARAPARAADNAMNDRKLGLAGRYLGAVVRLLPASRSEWGRAMHAELAAIDSPAERRRFVLGCTRAALLPGAKAHSAGRSLAAAGAVGLVLGGEVVLARAIGAFVPLVGALALLAWLGRRPSYLRAGARGPGDARRALGRVRARRSVPVGAGRGRRRLRSPPPRRPALGHVLRAAADAGGRLLPRDDRAGLSPGRHQPGRRERRRARGRRSGIRGAAVRAHRDAARPRPPRPRDVAGSPRVRRAHRWLRC